MNDIPEAIECEEVIVRGICHPFHLKKNGQLDWNAFRPPPERNDVSVIRHDYTGVEFCKAHAQELTDPTGTKFYCGLAFLMAGSAREIGADVVDSRRIYLGHADILHRVKAPPKGEPLPPAELDALREACKHLVRRSEFIKDPDPQGAGWLPALVGPPKCQAC